MSETWTVLRLLTWTTDFLKQRGAENPRLDAEVLLAAAKGCERIALYTAFDEVVSEDVRSKFRELVKRRAAGEPVAYLVGSREFYSLRLKVTPDVLIPRPETEFVVIAVLDYLKQQTQGSSPASSPQPPAPLIADVGTGSGAIAVAIARHAPSAEVIATDRSPAALAVAKENAAALGVDARVKFLEGDLLEAIPSEPRFTAIASNPPYISDTEYAALPAQVRDHEPKLALLAGPKGTEVIERLIPQAAERLAPGGLLALEVSPMIAGAVVDLIAADGRFQPASITKDLGQLARVVKALRR